MLLLLAVTATLLFFWVIKGFALTLVLAAVLAAVAQPLFRWLTGRLHGRETAAALLTVLLFLAVVIVPALLFLGELVSDAAEVSEQLQLWVSNMAQQPGGLQQAVEQSPVLNKLLPYQDQIVKQVVQLTGTVASFVGRSVVAGATGAASFFLKLFIALFAMFTFLKDGRAILDWIFECLPLSHGDRKQLVSTFSSVAQATLKGTLVIGIVQGGLAGAAFAVVGIEGAIFWGTVMAVLSIIPGIGTSLVWVPTVIYLALTNQTWAAVGLAVWCALVVGTADNLLRPALVGKSTKMSELMVLLATLGGLKLFGAAGILVGPVIGALFTATWALWGGALQDTTANHQHADRNNRPPDGRAREGTGGAEPPTPLIGKSRAEPRPLKRKT